MGVRVLVRRIWSDRLTAVALIVTVVLAMTLLAAGPIYSDAVAVGTLRRSLTDAPARDTVVDVGVRSAPAEYVQLNELATAGLERATADVGADISRSIVSSETFELPGQSGRRQVDLSQLSWVESVEHQATIIAGSWPDDGAGSVEVAVDSRVAELFGLDVGRALTMRPRTGSAPPVTVSISGVYVLDDPFGPFWLGRDQWTEGVRDSRQFRTARLLTTRSAMLSGLSERVEAGWLALPRLDQIELDDVGPTRRRVAALDDRLDDALAAFDDDPRRAGFDVDTALPSLLVGSERSLTVARSAVFAVVAQLALLAGYALMLVAGLTVDARRAESALLRARGAGSRQLLGGALLEGLVLVVPAVLIAPFLASWLLRVFDDFGPMASIGLEIDPRPVAAASVALAIAGLVTVLLLAWPTFRVARNAEQEQHRHRRQRLRTSGQRAGVDIALVALSAVAFWQLSTLGEQRASSVRGRFGVDPLLIAAPTFGLVAGSILALRVIPVLARVVERLVGHSRSIVPALSGWQLARRPTRYGRAGLLLIMAFAIGTFAATYEATWSRSQDAQAAHQAGADMRLTPNRRTNESVTDLHLVAMHEQLDGIARSVPVVSQEVDLPGTDRRGRILAIDAARAGSLGQLVTADESLQEGLQTLAGRRPEMIGVELPGRPSRLNVSLVVNTESGLDHDDDEAPPPGLSGAVFVVLQDGHDLLHRLELGSIPEAAEVVALTADLTSTGSDGGLVAPVPPLSIVDIELRIAAPSPPGLTFLLDILSFESTDVAGDRQPIDLLLQAWRLDSTPLGFVNEQPSLERSAVQPEAGLGLVIGTGSTRLPVPVLFNIRPAGPDPQDVLSAIAAEPWMIESGTSVGDVISVALLRAEPVQVEIVAVVDAVPTIDPFAAHALVIDLPTLEILEYGPGQSPRIATEHWLALDGEAGTIETQVSRAPIEAVDIAVFEQRRAALTADPPALGTIGALMLGFVAAAIFASVGFIVTTVISARERRLEFALLRALGLTIRQLRRWMLIEQFGLIAIGVLFGTAIGLALGALTLPLVSLTQSGDAVYPAVEVVYPWTTYLVLQVVVIAGVVVGLTLVNGVVRRVATSAALREGDEA